MTQTKKSQKHEFAYINLLPHHHHQVPRNIKNSTSNGEVSQFSGKYLCREKTGDAQTLIENMNWGAVRI